MKKFQTKNKKPIDKSPLLWYNIYNERGTPQNKERGK
jgi:hypothetical protein